MEDVSCGVGEALLIFWEGEGLGSETEGNKKVLLSVGDCYEEGGGRELSRGGNGGICS